MILFFPSSINSKILPVPEKNNKPETHLNFLARLHATLHAFPFHVFHPSCFPIAEHRNFPLAVFSMFHVYVFLYFQQGRRRKQTQEKTQQKKNSVSKKFTNDDVKKSQQLIIEVQCERT